MHCTEVRFFSFFSGGFITATVVNPPERKLAKHTSVHFVRDLTLARPRVILKLSMAGSGLPVVARFLQRASETIVNGHQLEVIFLYIAHVSINKLSLGAIHCVRDLTLARPRVILKMLTAGSGLPVVAGFLQRTSATIVNGQLLDANFLYIYLIHMLGSMLCNTHSCLIIKLVIFVSLTDTQ